MKNMQFLLRLIFLLVHSVTEKSYQRFAGGKITGFLVAFQIFETKMRLQDFSISRQQQQLSLGDPMLAKQPFLCHLCVGKTILFHYFCGPSTFFRLQIKRCSSKNTLLHSDNEHPMQVWSNLAGPLCFLLWDSNVLFVCRLFTSRQSLIELWTERLLWHNGALDQAACWGKGRKPNRVVEPA